MAGEFMAGEFMASEFMAAIEILKLSGWRPSQRRKKTPAVTPGF
jgi:hypothetical protein